MGVGTSVVKRRRGAVRYDRLLDVDARPVDEMRGEERYVFQMGRKRI